MASDCGLNPVLARLASCAGLAGLRIRIPASWIAALASLGFDGSNSILHSVSPICPGMKPAANSLRKANPNARALLKCT